MRDCPCGSGRAFDACCGALLAGAPAGTAEALMRSRYSAHVVGDVDYVVRTHDPRSRDGLDRVAIGRWARESEWLGLTIVATEAGGADDDTGIVEFQARYAIRSGVQLHHERSSFRRVDGAWVYVAGDFVKPTPVRSPSAVVGRNDPCPCGSGKKYKKCHGG